MSSLRFQAWGQIAMYTVLIALVCLILFGCGTGAKSVNSPPSSSSSPMGRILKGRNAVHGEHPYLVSFQYLVHRDENGLVYAPFCGGAILDRKTILTAGHCFEAKPDCWVTDPHICYRIVAGEHDITKDQEGEQIQVFPIGAIKVHENYDGFHYDNDIALVELQEPLNYTKQVQRISLVKRDKTYSNEGVIAGWGMTMKEGVEGDPHILQEANVTIYPDEHCTSRWGDDYHKEEMMCAGNGGMSTNRVGDDDPVPDACFGDSGGPLITTDFDDPTKKCLIGLISWGYDCGYQEYPGLYTRIEAYLEWIMVNRPRQSRKYRRMMRLRKLRSRHHHH